MRIGVIGAGIAGLATAWLLDEEHHVVLWERRAELGGHARTARVELDGVEVPVDTGFQHFSTGMYPTFTRLLELLDVPSLPSAVTCSVFWPAAGRALAVTPGPRPADLGRALRPGTLSWLLQLRAAIHAGARVSDWQQTVAEYLRELRLTASFKSRFLLPFLTALLGTSLDDAGRMSARAALRYPVAHQPSHPLRPFEMREIAGGAVRYVEALRRGLGRAEVRGGAEVTALTRHGGGWRILEDGGRATVVDRLVVATPAERAARLLRGLPGQAERAALLARLELIDTRIAVHSDTGYLPPRRRWWAGYNIRVEAGTSEGTIWSGRRQGVPVCKSWVTHREATPRRLHLSESFRHPLMTPEYFRVQRRLAALEGAGDLWLAGSYLADIDSHESGLLSAMAVAARLAGGSRRLAQLAGGAATSARRAVA